MIMEKYYKICLPFLFIVSLPTNYIVQLYFPPTSGNTWDTTSISSLNWCQEKVDSLYDFLEENNSKAFILLKDGKIVLEQYFNGHTSSSIWQWASAGKTITSFMVGMAQQEGFLDITDTTAHIIGSGWTNCTQPQEEKITVRHQLTMTTGLDDGVSDVYCTLDTCLNYLTDAGNRWAYHNGPYTLLDSVIEIATGVNLNLYTNQKLEAPTGMNGLFYYVGYNNVYFSNARTMARFGLLMLNNGNWDGNQIMTDNTYFNEMINTSQNLNQSYGYLWWLNGKSNFMLPMSQLVFNGSICPNAPDDMYAALGKDGQIINVVPSMNMVWIRMGEAPGSGSSLVSTLLSNDIWAYLNDLECTSSINENNKTEPIRFFPSPASNYLTYKVSDKQSINLSEAHIEIHNLQGQLVLQKNTLAHSGAINIIDLPAGIYIISFITPERTVLSKIEKAD